MGIKTYKPTVAGAPLLLGQRLRGAHQGTSPSRTLLEHQTAPAAVTTTAASPAASAAVVTSSATASSTSARDKIGVPAEGRLDRVRSRTAPRASRSSTTSTARSATSSRPTASRSATRSSRAATPTSSPATRLPLRAHPARHDDPQHRDEEGQGRPARSLGRRRGAAHGEGRRLRAGSPARAAKSAWSTSTAAPPSARCRTSTTRTSRSARPVVRAGSDASAQPRRHHEPGRSPDGRWRRPHVRWSSPVLAVGSALQGPQDPQQQAHRRHDRQAPRAEGLRQHAAFRSRRARSSTVTSRRRSTTPSGTKSKKVIKTWSRRSHDRSRGRRPHVRRAQRPQVRPGVRHGEHGRAQARRVRADAHVPRSLRATRRPRSREPDDRQEVSRLTTGGLHRELAGRACA